MRCRWRSWRPLTRVREPELRICSKNMFKWSILHELIISVLFLTTVHKKLTLWLVHLQGNVVRDAISMYLIKAASYPALYSHFPLLSTPVILIRILIFHLLYVIKVVMLNFLWQFAMETWRSIDDRKIRMNRKFCIPMIQTLCKGGYLEEVCVSKYKSMYYNDTLLGIY